MRLFSRRHRVSLSLFVEMTDERGNLYIRENPGWSPHIFLQKELKASLALDLRMSFFMFGTFSYRKIRSLIWHPFRTDLGWIRPFAIFGRILEDAWWWKRFLGALGRKRNSTIDLLFKSCTRW